VSVIPTSGSAELDVGGRRLALTNLDRVLWPAAGFSKGQMLEYYAAVAPALLPHVAERPLTLGRFPAGVDGRGFAQNECRGRPDWLATAALPLRSGELRQYCVVNDLPSLLWVANQNTIELHPYLAHRVRPKEPTAVVFDLDPERPADLIACCEVALLLREELGRAGLEAFVKTSGAAGLHVLVPLNASHAYDETKAFARALARQLAAEHPDRVVSTQRRSARRGKVLVDWLQNDPMRSTAAVYSLRATSWPLVSTPITFDEVEEASARRKQERLLFEPTDVLDRLERFGDLFAPANTLVQTLPR
jgi:bifunctional non-homologous end joining protein LigD